MKKLIAALAALLFAAGTALAETPSLDQIRKFPGYSSDEFEKTWSCVAEFDTMKDSRAEEIALGFVGDDSGLVRAPFLRLKVAGKTVCSALIRIGDDVWSFEKVYRGPRTFRQILAGEGSSYILLGTGGEELLRALAGAESVSVRLKWNSDSLGLEFPRDEYGVDITISGGQAERTLGAAAKLLLDSGLYAAMDPALAEQADSLSPAVKK